MATNSRDVELRLKVATLGEEGIRSLEERVRALAQEGSDAAPEFERLADEIAQLGQNAAALRNIDELARDVENLAVASERTTATAHDMARELADLSAVSATARAAQAALSKEFSEAKAAVAGYEGALSTQRKATTDAEKDTVAYKLANQALRVELERAKQEVIAREVALRAAKNATEEAAEAEDKFAKTVTRTTREADDAARALADRNTELLESRAALEAAGVATEDLAAAQIRLINELNHAEDEANKLNASVTKLAASERQLADIRAFETVANDAARLVKAGDYVRFWEQALQSAETQAKQTATSVKQTATDIENAFRTVGTKDVAALQGEIVAVREAMKTLGTTAGLTGFELERAMAVGNGRIRELERDIRAATGQLTVMDRVTSGLKSTIGQFAAAFGAYEIGTRLAQGFLQANVQIEKLRLGLGTVYKDVGLAASQIKFLQNTANTAGVSVDSISQSFVKFAASMNSANIPVAESNALFQSLTQAAGTLGLSGDKVSHMLDALSQMAGKGVVSLEELRQQLGDSLPGALGLVAKGFGITEAELIKLVESGQLAARDLFPALTKSLRDMGGEVNTLSGTWERFKNVLTTVAVTAGDSGWTALLKVSLQGLAVVVAAIVVPLQGLFEIIFGVARAAGVLVGAIATLSNPLDALGEIVEAADRRMNGLVEAFDNMRGASGGVATSTGQAGTAIASVGTAADGASGSIVKLQVDYTKLINAQTSAVEATEKQVKAVEKQGAALVTLAGLIGDERKELEASVAAANANVAATTNLANKKAELVATLTAERDAILKTAAANGEDAKQREVVIKAINEKILKAQASADVSAAEAEQARVSALAQRISAEAYENNADKVDELREAMILANAIRQETARLEIEGKRTKDDVVRATENAVAAEAKYGDALRDSAAQSERYVGQVRLHLSLREAGLNLAIAEARAAEDVARRLGNEYGVRQAQIKIKEIELQIAKLKIDATLAEAAAMDVATDARIQELIAMGKWTPAMEAEINARRINAEIKRKEAEAAALGIAAMEKEIQSLKNGSASRNEQRESSRGLTSEIGRETNARQQNIDKMDEETKKMFELNKLKLTSLYNANKIQESNKTNDGFEKNADGSAKGTFTNMLPMDLAYQLAKTGTQGMTPEQVQQAITQAENVYRDMEAFRKLNPGAASTEYQTSATAMMNAANIAKQQLTGGTMNSGDGSFGNSGGGSTRTVKVQIGGTTSSVNVASQQDSDTLVSMLRSLESASKTAA